MEDGDPCECPECGGYALHFRCWDCGGDGEFDLYEDNPNEYEPGEVDLCDTCEGKGHWFVCKSGCDDKVVNRKIGRL